MALIEIGYLANSFKLNLTTQTVTTHKFSLMSNVQIEGQAACGTSRSTAGLGLIFGEPSYHFNNIFIWREYRVKALFDRAIFKNERQPFDQF